MKSKYRTNNHPGKPTVSSNEETELVRSVFMATSIFLGLFFFIFFGVKQFGPQIGGFFGLLSLNRGAGEIGDTFAPQIPILNGIPEATNKKEITINGFTESGVTVELFVNGPKVDSQLSDSSGLFTFNNIKIRDGKNVISARAIDSAGNESERSQNYEIIFDDKAPKIEEITPSSGDTIKNLDKRIPIEGKLNEKGEVSINGRKAITKADNSFSILLGVDDEGEKNIEIIATDVAGNETKMFLNVTYKRD